MSISEGDQLAGDIISGLQAPVRLHRDAALQKLEQRLRGSGAVGQQACLDAICNDLLRLLSSDVWQHRLGGFEAAQMVIPALPITSPFLHGVLSACQAHLEDEEPRVRGAVADCVRALALQRGTSIFDAMGQQITLSIQAAFARDPVAAENGGGSSGDAAAQPDFLGQLLQTSYRQQRPGQGELRHDTEGWRSLESSFHALQALVEGCGSACLPFLTAELRQLVLDSLLHQNRFVRERGHRVVSAVVAVCDEASLRALAPEVAARLADGLNDSWSHVQYAASEATRSFLQATEPFRNQVLPALLPAMFFNRHTTAEGLRSYSQATWELAMETSGRAWVARCINEVVAFFGKQARSSSTDKREAACACMPELAVKIERQAVEPHVGPMLRCLLGCFRDSSWPVREAACEACGQFALAYPEAVRGLLPQLWPLWLEALSENVPAARETAAVAVGNAVRAFGDEALQMVLPAAQDLLRRVQDQPADVENYIQTSYGIAAVRVDEPPPPDEDDAMFGSPPATEPETYQQSSGGGGSGSSGPGRSGKKAARLFSTSAMSREPAGCCMDDGFQRERQPWEAADGAVYLVRELAAAAPDTMPQLMPALAEAVRHNHYAHACHLQETTWQQLPVIAQHLGKRGFKRHLEPFLDPLFMSVQSATHQGCQTAAIAAAGFLRDWLGPRIWAGRLSPQQQDLMLRFVPTVVRANKACYAAKYDKFGSVSRPEPPAMVH